MVIRRLLRPTLEAIGFLAALAATNWLWFRDPGFQNVGGWPYFLVPVLFASMYGLSGALLAGAATVLLIGIEFFVAPGLRPELLLPGGLAGSYVTAGALYVRWVFVDQGRRYRARFRDLVVKNTRLSRENRVMEELCRELEARISRDRRSLTALVTRLNTLERESFQEALQQLLSVVGLFLGAEKASLWRYDASGERLVLEAAFGWPTDESAPAHLSTDRSIPGWVSRNGQSFSLRMATEQPHFQKRNEILSLLAYPVRVGDQVWGVLNIEAMPFVKYSRHAESLLEVILKLAGRSLKTILERESLFARQETGGTGLPGVAVLVRALDEAVRRSIVQHGSFSLVLVELSNGAELDAQIGREETDRLLLSLATLVQEEASEAVTVFEYKSERQLAFYLADRDGDGTALFCLGLLGAIQGHAWNASGTAVRPEVLLGYGVLRPGMTDPRDLMDQAERLIEMQRAG